MRAHITILDGPIKGMSVALNPETPLVLGRHVECSLQFLDSRISNYHLRIFFDKERYVVEDFGSTNGTYINDIRISSPCELQQEDVLQVGEIRLRFTRDGTKSTSSSSSAASLSSGVIKTEILSSVLGDSRVGDYLLLQKLGGGATGEIFRAQHTISNDIVALKILHAHQMDKASLQRFTQEAFVCMQFSHSRIVKVFEFGMYEDRPVLAMEYIDGIALSKKLQNDGAMDEKRALEVILQIVEGVEYIHGRDIVHRDLNPANIMLDSQENVKIIDFGLIKMSGKGVTLACETLGTLRYIPPEQIDDAKSVDRRADIYAVGAILYHLLSGKAPYAQVKGLHNLILQITAFSPPALSTFTSVSPSVSDLVARAMAPVREDRYQASEEIRGAISAELRHISQ